MYNAGKYTYGEILPIKSIYGTLDNDKKEKVAFKAYLQVTCNLTYTSVIVTNGLRTYSGYIDSSGFCIIEIEKAGKYFIVGKHKEKESIPEQIEIRDNSHLYEFDIEIPEPKPEPVSYLTFSSAEQFTVGFTYKAWDGIIEISYDKKVWQEWDGLTVLSSNSENELYIRGIGNTKLHDYDEDDGSFILEATSEVECVGNIEFLLDYQTVLNGQHPIMAEHCFQDLFYECSMLSTSPELTADVLSPYCYYGMFYGCTSLRVSPDLPATTLAEGCYSYMFEECRNLTTAPELPATTLAIKCYKSMFESCGSLVNAPSLPATIMTENCYDGMFKYCSSLVAAPILPATTLADYCYHDMFLRCAALVAAPALPATVLADSCYDSMFNGCASLTIAPVLPATTLTYSCYRFMFAYCSSLTTPPELPAITLAGSCYQSMFYYCTSLTTAPSLPATTMSNQCYSGMFINCISLTTSPELPATTLENSCYNGMFFGCTSITEVPELPATTLSGYCYADMFRNCTSLTTPPELPALTLVDGCYSFMFMGCDSIKLSEIQTNLYTTPYRIPVEGEGSSAYGTMNGMFRDTGGTFTDTPIINTTYYLWNPITYLTFSSEDPFTLGVAGKHWDGTVEYSLDKSTWSTWDGSTAISSNNSNEIYLRGSNNTRFSTGSSYNNFIITATSGVDCTGNIENLLDYQTVLDGQHPVMNNHCYTDLFANCYKLTSAPSLPATTLSAGCYRNMFEGCTSLTTAPSLPAITLAEGCYKGMFTLCTSLTTTPSLPARTLTFECYRDMFWGCSSLTAPPALPATTLARRCYYDMFWGCSSLTTPPELPAITLAEECYGRMFYDCSSLTSLPELPATTLTNYCYELMFMGCGSIKLSASQTSEYTVPYRIPSSGTGISALSSLRSMFSNTGGTFTGTPEINTTYYLWDPITYLTFSSNDPFTLGVRNKVWDGTLEYSTDKSNWTTWDGLTAISSNNSNELYLRGTGNTKFYDTTSNKAANFVITSTSGVNCIGNIEFLLDYQTVLDGQHPTMGDYCYRQLFASCTSLITTPSLPATTLSRSCYEGIFTGCTSLTNAPELPATTLAMYCYSGMFSGCTALTTSPELPATILGSSCYYQMFKFCSALVAAPSLPATTLASGCYQGMFRGCTSLTTSPSLPATTLGSSCYREMFYGCTSLTTPPALPATTIIDLCYQSMFHGCTSLTTLPNLPATELKIYCYDDMFGGCTSIKVSATRTSEYTTPYRIPSEGTGVIATNALRGMFTNTGGTFTGTPEINTTYYLWNPVTYLTFSSDDPFTLGITNKGWDSTVEYSTDKNTWTTWDGSTAISSNNSNEIYLRGTGNSYISRSTGTQFVISATSGVRCDGNIENLVDYQTVLNGEQPTGIHFYGLFYNCKKLVSAPSLPSMHLNTQSYASMFSGCTSLTTAPELPATTLAESCYVNMFHDCTSLTAAPTLPATTLAAYCYFEMFGNCTSLVTPPALPATTLAASCYTNMFYGCTSLKVSQTQTENYTIPYRIPSQGSGTIGTRSLYKMFYHTGGTFTGTPKINTTYYLWNPTYGFENQPVPFTETSAAALSDGLPLYTNQYNAVVMLGLTSNVQGIYVFAVKDDATGYYFASEMSNSFNVVKAWGGNASYTTISLDMYNSTSGLYYKSDAWGDGELHRYPSAVHIPEFSSVEEGLSALRAYLDSQ